MTDAHGMAIHPGSLGKFKKSRQSECFASCLRTTPRCEMIAIQADEVVMNQQQAAEFTKLSAKTLERMALAGEDIGRIKVSKRRVLFLKSKLVKYFADKAASNVVNPSLN
jgi:hypothetical protein